MRFLVGGGNVKHLARHTAFLLFPSTRSKHLGKGRTPGTNDVTALAEGDTHTHTHKIFSRVRGFSLVASYAFVSNMAAMISPCLQWQNIRSHTHRFLDRKWIYVSLPVSLETSNKYSKTSAVPAASLQQLSFLLQLKRTTALLKGHRGKSVKELEFKSRSLKSQTDYKSIIYSM